CYEGENISWMCTIVDSSGSIATVTGQTIEYKVKALATDPDPPLLSGTCAPQVPGTDLKFLVAFKFDLDPGTYQLGIRRSDVGFVWQYMQCAVQALAASNGR